MIHTENLFQEFDAVSTEDWVNAIEKFLKGKPIDSLNWEIEEGLVVSPIQRADDSMAQYIASANLAPNNNWNICEAITVAAADYALANKSLLQALDKGANALMIELLELPSPSDLKILLQGVLLDLIPLHFKGAALLSSPTAFLQNLLQLPTAPSIHGSCDFGAISATDLINGIHLCSDSIPNLRLINIPIENTTSKSLSEAIYQASLWIDRLLEKGEKIEQIATFLRFEFYVAEHYFIELARIRAFKKLWFGLLEAYGASEASLPYLHATTLSDQNENQYWNMIAATTQAMSAALAGVDSIYIRPCSGKNKADDFTRRIARNVQHLLQSESYLNRVIDPSAGAYYIEHITAALAQKTLQQFCNL